MIDSTILNAPPLYIKIVEKSEAMGFTMPSDIYIGTLLRTLIASKPGSNFLELGTGASLSLVWMIDGMDKTSELITVDNDPKLSQLAEQYFGEDHRINIVCQDGSEWINNYTGAAFDLIFADAWPGKYSDLEQTLSLLKIGGFYIIDDMNTQENWPEGHQEKVDGLLLYLDNRPDLMITKMNWSTGVVIATKI